MVHTHFSAQILIVADLENVFTQPRPISAGRHRQLWVDSVERFGFLDLLEDRSMKAHF